MKFQEIARFLNINEADVKSLCDRGVLPGCKYDEGWKTTIEEIENWYIQLTGKEWANLVYRGNVDPILVEIELEEEVTKKILFNTLKSMAEKGIIKVISHNFEDENQLNVSLIFSQEIEKNRRGIKALERAELMESIIDQIKLTYECEEIIREYPVFATIKNNRILILSTKEKMEDLPQRNREIIKFYLFNYASQLCNEIYVHSRKEVSKK